MFLSIPDFETSFEKEKFWNLKFLNVVTALKINFSVEMILILWQTSMGQYRLINS